MDNVLQAKVNVVYAVETVTVILTVKEVYAASRGLTERRFPAVTQEACQKLGISAIILSALKKHLLKVI